MAGCGVLSVPFDDVPPNLTIPLAALESVWMKESELVTSTSSTFPAPGHPPQGRMVVKSIGLSSTPGYQGFYHCDSECVNYQSLEMCNHVVVVAQVNGEFELCWYFC